MNEVSRARMMKEMTAPAWDDVETFCLVGVSEHGFPILINTNSAQVTTLLGALEIAKQDILHFIKNKQNKETAPYG